MKDEEIFWVSSLKDCEAAYNYARLNKVSALELVEKFGITESEAEEILRSLVPKESRSEK